MVSDENARVICRRHLPLPRRLLILEAFHHPYDSEGNSKIQRVMYETMERWVNNLSDDERELIIENLTKVCFMNFSRTAELMKGAGKRS